MSLRNIGNILPGNIKGIKIREISVVEETDSQKLLRSLSQLNIEPTLTSHQIERLLDLVDVDGEKAYRKGTEVVFLVEVGDLLNKYNFEDALNILRYRYSQETDISILNPDLDASVQMVTLMNAKEQETEAFTNVGICRKCGCNLIYVITAQLRRIDEGMDTKLNCAKCGSSDIKEYSNITMDMK